MALQAGHSVLLVDEKGPNGVAVGEKMWYSCYRKLAKTNYIDLGGKPMKKLLALLLVVVMVFSLAACGGETAVQGNDTAANNSEETNHDHEDETPSTVTVETAYGPVEVPYAPERVCVLDLSTMDIIDALGLGEKVVTLGWHKHYPTYLESYYTSETIISLQTSRNNNKGQSEETTASTEETTDPNEIYYGIDADLIIGTTEKITEELYAILSQIAPTVAMEPALENEEGIYTGMRANAALTASIWGLDEEFAEMIAPYDAIYDQLVTEAVGKTYVMASGDDELGTIRVDAVASGENADDDRNSENSDKSGESTGKSGESANQSGESSQSNKKNNTDNLVTFLTQLGMVNVTDTVPQDVTSGVIEAAVAAGTSVEDAAKLVIDGINSTNSDAVFIFNYKYPDLDAVRAAGFDLLGVENLTGGVAYVSVELTYTTGGLTAVTGTLDDLAGALLN